MEENKNIETEAPEKLEDNDLESASAGCVFKCCNWEEKTVWIGVMYDGTSRTFRILQCRDCGRVKYLRSTRGDGEPDAREREISRDEYKYYCCNVFGFAHHLFI